MKLLVIDTETGGLDPAEHSILTLGATVWPPDANVFAHYRVRENPYSVTPGALAVNKIDLVEHDANALEPASVWAAFMSFCASQPDLYKVAGRYVLGGHNTAFDIGFLKRLHRLSGDSRAFSDIFSHRFVDTMAAGLFLLFAGRLPTEKKALGLADLARAFEVEQVAAHTALGDALTTAKLFEAMLATVRG